MDIKLRSNDAEEIKESAEIKVADEVKEVKKKRPRAGFKARGMILFLSVLLALGFVFVNAANLLRDLRRREAQYWMQAGYGDNLAQNALYNSEVYDRLTRYAKNLHRYFIYYDGENYEYLPDSEKVRESDIEQKRSELLNEYTERLRELRDSQNSRREQVTMYGRNEAMFKTPEAQSQFLIEMEGEFAQEYVDLYNEYYDKTQNWQELVYEENQENYALVKEYLESETQLTYYILDNKTNTFRTNIASVQSGYDSIDRHLSDKNTYYFNVPLDYYIFSQTIFAGNDIASGFINNNLSGYIFVRRMGGTELSNQIDSSIYINEQRFYVNEYTVLLVISLLFLLVVLSFALKDAGKIVKANAFFYKLYSYLPFTLKAGLGLGAAGLATYMFTEPFSFYEYILYDPVDFIMAPLYIGCAAAMLLGIFLSFEYIIITLRNPRSLKSEPEVRWIRMYINDIRYIIKSRDIWCILLYLLMIACFLFSLLLIVTDLAPMLLFSCGLVFLGHCFFINYAKLVFSIKEMSAGHMDVLPAATGLFSGHLKNLGKIQSGMEIALADMIRNERLKAELITNVSHDLKTPLTSIINYVALLKETPNQGAIAAEYIDVIDKKSERLKVLIDDLFDATKLNSGTVELVKEWLDVVDLINQSIGELSERINEAGLIIKFTYEPEHIYLDMDGKKIWRVFDNILSNIIKYSAPNSRAYIHAEETPAGVSVVFKNMSLYELNVPAEELFHRFKRGDASRSTEGSGLGLSIARSIVELHGGRMYIEVDGDLFKVTIVFCTNTVNAR